MLDLFHKILLSEIKEIAERNMSVEQCANIKAIVVGGYRFYFYDSYEERNNDYEIAERFVRLKNC